MARAGRTLAAVVAALCCGAAASCDNLADLVGRLSLDAAVPSPQQRTAFAAPATARAAWPALSCAPPSTARLGCGRAPAFSLGYPLLGSRAALQGAGSDERAFWAPVAAASRTRSAVAALAMRSASRKAKSVVPSSSVRPGTRIQQRPSHQVSAPGPLAGRAGVQLVKRNISVAENEKGVQGRPCCAARSIERDTGCSTAADWACEAP